MARWDHDDLRDKSVDYRNLYDTTVDGLTGSSGGVGVNGTLTPKEPVPYKYHEPEILAEIAKYIDMTYAGHYVGEDNIQSLDLILATGHATGFNIGNILKYGSRYGKKRGYNRDDLLKVIHYAIFELYNHSRNPHQDEGE